MKRAGYLVGSLLIALSFMAVSHVSVRAAGVNCDNFSSQAEAQAYFDDNGGSPTNNVEGLDADGDGVPCETYNYGSGGSTGSGDTSGGDTTSGDTSGDTSGGDTSGGTGGDMTLPATGSGNSADDSGGNVLLTLGLFAIVGIAGGTVLRRRIV